MDAKKTFEQLRKNRAARIILVAVTAILLMAVGSAWSPQSQAVDNVKNCVNSAHALKVNDARCMPLVREMSK